MLGKVYVYGKNAEDFDNTGLCGALLAKSCEHEEIGGGLSQVKLVHPYDRQGRWRHLVGGNWLKCDVRVRTTPEIEGGQAVMAVEVWTVKPTATKAQRGVFSAQKKGRKLVTLAPGVTVIVLRKGDDRYKIKYQKKNKKGWGNGWIAHDAIQFELAETLPEGVDGIETVAPPWVIKPQLFEIMSVERSLETKSRTVTVTAVHASYTLNDNVTNYLNREPLTAQEALDGIFDNLDFETECEAYTDSADVRTSCDWRNVSPVAALLDPETGFLARWNLELVRDDFEMYFLRRAGRNRGARIEYGKNLLGVSYKVIETNVVTAIKPTGVKKDGSLLYLTDDEDSPDNYIYSSRVNEYARVKAITLACDDCTVDGKQITRELARTRMRDQAQRKFDEEQCDLPDVTVRVRFLELGDTVEYQQYKDLAPVYLYDEVPVAAANVGIEIMADVRRTLWDCLNWRLLEIDVGNVREGVDGIYKWQVPSLPGSKLLTGSTPGSALEDGTVPENKLDPDLQEALRKAWADIATAQEMIDAAHAWLDTLEYQLETVTTAVGDNAGNIAALQIAADVIRAAVRDAESNIAVLELTAHDLQLAMENAEGDISMLIRSANEASSTFATMDGRISDIRQNVDSITQTISGPGGLVSQIQQLSDRVAFKLSNPAIGGNFEVRIARAPSWFLNSNMPHGIAFYQDGEPFFFIAGDGSFTNLMNVQMSAKDILEVDARRLVHIQALNSNTAWMSFDGDNNRINAGRALTVDSDARLKTDIRRIRQGEALFDALVPLEYRFKIGAECLHYGFLAQAVKAAQKKLGIRETALLSDIVKDGGFMGLVYQELHALTVNKVQLMEARYNERFRDQQAQINQLSAALAAITKEVRDA